MKPLTKKQLQNAGCVFLSQSGGAITVIGPVGTGWTFTVKTLKSARLRGTQRIQNEKIDTGK